MPSIRLRRLQADYEKVKEVFWNNSLVKVEVLEGNPPHKYLITYNVKGLSVASNEPVVRKSHKVEIYLPESYPRDNPICTMKTPHFHPNIFADSNKFCLGDWAAAETLMDVIARIGRLLQYQEYNLKSPANRAAKSWVEENTHKLPIDTQDIGIAASVNIRFFPAEKAPTKTDDEFEITLY